MLLAVNGRRAAGQYTKLGSGALSWRGCRERKQLQRWGLLLCFGFRRHHSFPRPVPARSGVRCGLGRGSVKAARLVRALRAMGLDHGSAPGPHIMEERGTGRAFLRLPWGCVLRGWCGLPGRGRVVWPWLAGWCCGWLFVSSWFGRFRLLVFCEPFECVAEAGIVDCFGGVIRSEERLGG